MRRGLLGLLLLVTSTAVAAEGEQAISVGAGYCNLSLPQDTPDGSVSLDGGLVDVDYDRGLSDTFWFRATATGAAYDGPDSTAYSAGAVVGLLYQFDVAKYVPYLSGGLGGVVGWGGGVQRKVAPVMELGAGLEILRSRSFSYGLALRWDAFASEARFLTVTAKVTWRWGYF